jgi:predicted aspartyl protease
MSVTRNLIATILALSGLSLVAAGRAAAPVDTAEALFYQNHFPQARTAFASAVHASPGGLAARIGLVRTLMRLDAWQEAVTQGRAATVAAPKNGDAHGIFSLALFRAGQPEAAEREARTAIGLDPTSYWALVAAGRAAIWNDDDPVAKVPLRKATTLRADWPEGWLLLVEALDAPDRAERGAALKSLMKLKPMGHPYDMDLEGTRGMEQFARSFEKDKSFRHTGRFDAAALKNADTGEAPAISMTIPIERDDHNFVIVPIEINGRHLRLLFDSGAGDSISLMHGIAGRLGVAPLATSVARGVNGKETSKLYKADTVQVGDYALASVPVAGSDDGLGDLEGLLGGAFFKEFAVTLDFTENTMTLARGKQAAAPAPREGMRAMSIPFRLVDGYIYVPTEIAGRKTWCLLDTGASSTLVSFDLAKQIASERGTETWQKGTVDGRLFGGIGNTVSKIDVLIFGVSVPLGLMKDGHAPFHVEASPMLAASSMDSEVSRASNFQFGALVGIDYLIAANRVTIDYPHRVLTMEFPTGGPSL